MKTRTVAVAILSLFAFAALSTAQTEPHKLIQFQMAVIRKGPTWASKSEKERNSIRQGHLANILSLYDSGKAAIIGAFADNVDVAGVFVLRTSSAADAKTWMDADPAVKAGLMVAEIHPWWSEDVFRKPNLPLKLNTLYFGFLKKGPNRKEGDDKNPEIQELQKAHIANINRLAEMKKLVVAGPFGDDGELRGIFVFRVASLQEAQELCVSDPMIKVHRLEVELHPWQVPDGVLP